MNVNMIGISMDQLTHCDAHVHSQWEIVVCLRGRGLLRVGRREFDFSQGMIVCQPPNISHSLSKAENYRDMFIIIDDFIPPCSDEVPVCFDDEGGRFSALMQIMYESFWGNDANREQIVSGLWDIMYQLLTGWSKGRIRNQAVKNLAHTMIMNVSNTRFNLSEYLDNYGYSVDHLRRCFKKEMGLTPTAYMNKLRVDQACRLLDLPQHGGFTIKQIAYLSGFSDPYYFSNTFKKHLGCSPTEYIDRNNVVSL